MQQIETERFCFLCAVSCVFNVAECAHSSSHSTTESVMSTPISSDAMSSSDSTDDDDDFVSFLRSTCVVCGLWRLPPTLSIWRNDF